TMLRAGAPVLVPILVSILLSYTFEPLVAGLVRWRVPRLGAAIIVYLLAAILIVAGVRALRDQVLAFLDDLPRTIATVQDSVTPDDRDAVSPIDRVRDAARAIEQATRGAPAPAARGV